jgi:hypothetical protein
VILALTSKDGGWWQYCVIRRQNPDNFLSDGARNVTATKFHSCHECDTQARKGSQ